MHDMLATVWQEIAARPSGPMAFRFYMQPLMACLLAGMDGIKDARSGLPPFLWTLMTDPAQRRARWNHGWKSISRVFVFALVLDVIYQLVVLHALRPLEGLFIASALAFVPYVLVRGPVCRIARALMQRSPARHA